MFSASAGVSSLETVKHVDGGFKLGHVDHPECTVGLSKPNLPNTLSNGAHGLPIIRVTVLLHLIELIFSLATSGDWKGS
jgi:hypothetical protein